MGFKFNAIHSDSFDLGVITRTHPYIAPKRHTAIKVPGRDGEVVFEDGYDNLRIEFECKLANEDRAARRATIRSIAAWLADAGTLVIDHEDDLEYEVVLTVSDIVSESSDPQLPLETFDVAFVCKPHARSKLPAEELHTPVIAGSTVKVTNLGTYKALPVIKMEGVCGAFTVGGFSITSLSGIVFIDTPNQLVYSVSGGVKTNQIAIFSGEFPELNPGENSFPISGTITNLSLDFQFKHTYL